VNERGQVLIDPFMRSLSHPEVYALGDAAAPARSPSVPVRMSAYTAAVMGAHAADCLANHIRGRDARPLSFAYAGQGISLGRTDAAGFITYPDGRPHGPLFTGRVAVRLRRFFVHVLGNTPGYTRRWPGSFYWLGKGRVERQKFTTDAVSRDITHDAVRGGVHG
jgi:NADH dehydrogenase FAD-containing subunit